MTLVIEAFEIDRKTNIVYSHKQEMEVGDAGFISLKAQRTLSLEADRCVTQVKRKQAAAL